MFPLHVHTINTLNPVLFFFLLHIVHTHVALEVTGTRKVKVERRCKDEHDVSFNWFGGLQLYLRFV